jgi:hypothetical protein
MLVSMSDAWWPLWAGWWFSVIFRVVTIDGGASFCQCVMVGFPPLRE